jgi:uncharacterized protein
MAIEPLNRPWLVASWPGMGAVGQIANAHLVRTLSAKPVAELDSRSFFEVESIAVHQGLAKPSNLPRSVFYAWRDPAGAHDLLVLTGDRQPTSSVSRYAEALMDVAADFGVKRVITFAAMASPIHPTATPRVLGVATRASLLAEMQRVGVVPLDDGEISGLNGTFLAAASAREIPAACLLGEFPFFAAQVPNPKAAAAVVEALARIRGVDIDVSELKREAAELESDLVRHLEELQRAARESNADDERLQERRAEEDLRSPTPVDERPATEVGQTATELSRAEQQRIEALFLQAAQDRAKAIELKSELDRLGVFKRYEDRFLDLFKAAG